MLIAFFTAALAQSGGSFLSPGPLAQAHAELDSITQCTSCHTPLQGVDPTRCMACHERVKQQVDTRTGFHATKGKACETCHSDHRGLDFDLIRLRSDEFDHSETGFELTGKHKDLVCLDCHKSETDWTDLSPECEACHDDVHGGHQSKRADVLADCEGCHQTGGWRTEKIPKALFDHTNKQHVAYVLEDAHLKVECGACHFDFRFLPTPHDKCRDCHDNPHRADFGQPCESCHKAPKTWRVPGFDHARTPFRLEGQHQEVDCFGCHKGNRTVPLAYGQCSDCHTDVHRGQFAPKPCNDCHTVQVADFRLPQFDHATTDFPLVGKHADQLCDRCHGAGPEAVYRPKPHEDCKDCHDDNHAGQFEPTPCKVCHVETGWAVGEFDHDRTAFPLTGKHAGVECEQCHQNGLYAGLPHDSCANCHDDRPHHATLKPVCTDCHDTNGFEVLHFAHAAFTGFDLAPRHTELACPDCHKQTRDFTGEPSECLGCHAEDRPWGHYEGTCEGCHAGAGWLPAGLGTLDHAVTGFPLRGQHAKTPCEDCHGESRARGATPSDCGTCHRIDDPHRNLLGTACGDCHTESSWLKTRFRHQNTGWPLVGLHRVAECNDCHAVAFVGTPTECWRCHEAEAPLDIESHTSAFFPTCDECHSPYGWGAVRFAH